MYSLYRLGHSKQANKEYDDETDIGNWGNRCIRQFTGSAIDGRPVSVIVLETDASLIRNIRVVANPDKLKRIPPPT